MSASQPIPRLPFCVKPSARAGPADIEIATSYSVYSRSISGNVILPLTLSDNFRMPFFLASAHINSSMISGYRQKQPPFGWSVERKTCHGFLINNSSSSPAAHCTAFTRMLGLYEYGTMPQPVSFSTSRLPHFRPVSLYSTCCQGPSAVTVTVVPNSTAPASVVRFGCVLKYSAILTDSERIVGQSSPP